MRDLRLSVDIEMLVWDIMLCSR